ncbi:methylmalonyl Co-A mutase-associated GTPase MeaB [bacterium]|nr:methylmalonyl Co-A mutase-associated GTPase MeaB [bacterium]
MTSDELLDRFFNGDMVALAKVISLVENRSPDHERVLARLFRECRNAYRVGITGPPGAGKSTVVDKIAMHLAEDGTEMGIVAVDPTSPFTGGAVLGDRIRMKDLYKYDNIFIRSMATRGSLGGLASATKDVLVALDAYGKELILVETVGVGQVELDVVDACDTVVVMLTPEAGDSVQAMKAGLLEIADVFVVNKADRDGAEIFAIELQSILEIKENNMPKSSKPHWKTPIVLTVAPEDRGISDLWNTIEKHRDFIIREGIFETHRKLQIKHKIEQIIENKIRLLAQRKFLTGIDIDHIASGVYEGQIDPYSAVNKYCRLKEFENIFEGDQL